MISRAGDSSIETAMAWAPGLKDFGDVEDVEMYLYG